MKETSELKFSNSNETIRCCILKKVAKINIDIYTITIKKEHTKENLKKIFPYCTII